MADFASISSRNIFNSEGSSLENGGNKSVCELKKTDLPLKFTGVIFGGSAQTSLVVIESGSSAAAATEAFLLFDIAPGNAQIVDITRSRVFLERNGCMEYLDLEWIPPPKRRVAGTKNTRKPQMKSAALDGDTIREDGFERVGNKVQVERRWVDKALGIDFAKTLQDAKANPNLVGGTEIKGFILTKIRPNSTYEKMGLRDGDIVRAINNIELSGMAQAVQTLNQMRNEASISLVVERGGQTINISLDVRR
jgi:general secretion pathway protein C